MTLHLSEHHENSTLGTVIFMPFFDIEALHWELTTKNYKYARPDVEELPWGRQIQLADPFGNPLRFCEPSTA